MRELVKGKRAILTTVLDDPYNLAVLVQSVFGGGMRKVQLMLSGNIHNIHRKHYSIASTFHRISVAHYAVTIAEYAQ